MSKICEEKSENAKKHAFLTCLTLEIETHEWNWYETFGNQWKQCLKTKKLFDSEGFTQVVFKIDHVKVTPIAPLKIPSDIDLTLTLKIEDGCGYQIKSLQI
jgi:hypothetical protein